MKMVEKLRNIPIHLNTDAELQLRGSIENNSESIFLISE